MIPPWLVTLGVTAIVALVLFTVWALGVGRGHQIGWDDAHHLHLNDDDQEHTDA